MDELTKVPVQEQMVPALWPSVGVADGGGRVAQQATYCEPGSEQEKEEAGVPQHLLGTIPQ